MLYYGLLLFFVLEYVRPSSYVPALNALHLNSLVPLGVLAGSLLWSKTVKISEVLTSPNAKRILFFLFLIGMSVLTADVTLYSFSVFNTVIGYFLIYLVLRKEVYSLERIKGVLMTLVLVHLVVGLLTPQIFLQPGIRHYMASGSFLGDGNDFALSVNIAIPFCLFLMLEAKTTAKKVLYAGVLLMLIFAIVGTQSRGGTVALVCVGFYYWLKSDRKIVGVIGLIIVVGLVLNFAPPDYFERMHTLTSKDRDGSAQGRILAWKAGVQMATDHPILGVGAGHFPVKYGVEYRPAGYGRTEIPWQTAHSIYFVILGELGFPGIIFLFVFLFSNFFGVERVLREMRWSEAEQAVTYKRLLMSLNASLVAFAVGGAFLTAIYYPHLHIIAALSECGRNLWKKARTTTAVDQVPAEGARLLYGGTPV